MQEVHGTNSVLELESTAPRIKSDFRPRDEDLIQRQKTKQWRRERRLKRIITAAVGWLVMGWMAYLMMVTARSTPKIWDPYDILDLSRVWSSFEQPGGRKLLTTYAASLPTRRKSNPASDALQSSTILIRSDWTNQKTRPLKQPTSTTSN